MAKTQGGKALTYVDGAWIDGNPLILGPKNHAVWLSSVVFDGARFFKGVAPDLDRHCARTAVSARALGLSPTLTGAEIEEIAWRGIRKFPKNSELYICPMFYAESGFILADADSTRFVLSIYESPFPEPTGFSACLSSFRRPAADMAPTEVKASCLYPNVARAVGEAQEKGFDTAVVLDPNGDVAEFAYTNLFLVKNGAVHTPAANGTFLNGITRQRVIGLLRDSGMDVRERVVAFKDVLEADEVFATGNYAKVHPCVRIEDCAFKPGPVYAEARRLYMDFAQEGAKGGR